MGKKLDGKSYRDHLREQIYFLQSSAKLYDLGAEVEAKHKNMTLQIYCHNNACCR